MPLWPMLMGDAGGGGGPTGPIIRDGFIGFGNTNSATLASGALVTTLTNDLVIAVIANSRGTSAIAPVASVTSSSGLAWSRLGLVTTPMQTGNKHLNLEAWTAFAPVALAGEIITFHMPAAIPCNMGGAVAFHGVVGSSGVYTLDGIVLTASAANTGHPSVSITTVHGNDVLIWTGASGFTNGNAIPPTSFTQDALQNQGFGLINGALGLSHEIVAAPQTALTLEAASSQNVGACIAFALKGS